MLFILCQVELLSGNKNCDKPIDKLSDDECYEIITHHLYTCITLLPSWCSTHPLQQQLHFLHKRCSKLLCFQGMRIKGVSNEKCLIMPMDSSSMGRKVLKHLLSDRHGQNSTSVKSVVTIKIIPGNIEDTSFVSARANEFCGGGYQWSNLDTGMYIHAHESEEPNI